MCVDWIKLRAGLLMFSVFGALVKLVGIHFKKHPSFNVVYLIQENVAGKF